MQSSKLPFHVNSEYNLTMIVTTMAVGNLLCIEPLDHYQGDFNITTYIVFVNTYAFVTEVSILKEDFID